MFLVARTLAIGISLLVCAEHAFAMRLPGNVTPLFYNVTLDIDPRADSFSGDITIRVRLHRDTSVIVLNATKLEIDEATITLLGASASVTPLAAQAIADSEDFVRLQFAQTLPAGRGVLKIRFRGEFEKISTRGVFKQKELDHSYVYTQFEAINARRAFPCFDEPGWKTPWELTLVVPEEYVAISNTPESGTERLPNGKKQVRFITTPPLSSYLIAFAVGPFDVLDGGRHGINSIPLRYFTPKGRAKEARYAAEVTPKLLALLEDYFGQPHPFAKLDSVAIVNPIGFGAMENVGLITYGSYILLAKPEAETEQFRRRYANLAAHEISHMWFGNLVTMQWWDDLWLNESFATWMATKTVERFAPGWQVNLYRDRERQRAIAVDRLLSTRKVAQPVDKRDDLANAFDRITYEKGATVLAMFESWLKPQEFRRGVQRYLETHAFGNARSQDFLAALSGSNNIAPAFTNFIDQPGIPLLKVALDCKAAAPRLTVQQQRFAPAKTGTQSTERWQIPACFRYGSEDSEAVVCEMLSEPTTSISLAQSARCPDWVMANRGGLGYYLPLYEAPLFAKLLSPAGNKLSAEETIALLGDSDVLAQAGLLPYDQALKLAVRFASHSQPQVIQASLKLVAHINPEQLDSKQKQQFARMIQRSYGQRARSLGWQPKPGESDDVRLLRIDLLPLVAIEGNDSALRAEALRLARGGLKDRAVVSASMIEPILKTAAQVGDRSLFDAMLREAKRSAEYRYYLLSALGLFRDHALAGDALLVMLGNDFHIRDSRVILESSLGHHLNRPLAHAFVKARFSELKTKFPEDSPGRFPTYASGICDKTLRDDFADFYRDRAREFRGGARNFDQALESIDICLGAREAQKKPLASFLATQK